MLTAFLSGNKREKNCCNDRCGLGPSKGLLHTLKTELKGDNVVVIIHNKFHENLFVTVYVTLITNRQTYEGENITSLSVVAEVILVKYVGHMMVNVWHCVVCDRIMSMFCVEEEC